MLPIIDKSSWKHTVTDWSSLLSVSEPHQTSLANINGVLVPLDTSLYVFATVASFLKQELLKRRI